VCGKEFVVFALRERDPIYISGVLEHAMSLAVVALVVGADSGECVSAIPSKLTLEQGCTLLN
jgi:hypothetical protein